MDINAARLDLWLPIRRLIAGRSCPAARSDDRSPGPGGADYVITVIQVGGARAYEVHADRAATASISRRRYHRPRRSFEAALAPVLQRRRDMEALCPRPATQLYQSDGHQRGGIYTALRLVGARHSVQVTATWPVLASLLAAGLWAAGVDHLPGSEPAQQ